MSDCTRLAALADACVMCGLCLPTCPTYGLDRQEGESPRGRIALIRGLAEGRLSATPALVSHLDGCLACRRCESVCPANVRYGELIAGARALPVLRGQRPAWLRRCVIWLTRLHRRRVLLAARPLARGLAWLGRGRDAPWWQRLRLLAQLPAPERRVTGDLNPPVPAATVLFPGCVADPYEAGVRSAARALLERTGEAVTELGGDLCCGSMARYAGMTEQAARQEHALLEQVRRSGAGLVLGSASGCQGRLREVLADAGIPSRELHVHVARALRRQPLPFRPLAARVALHRPCSQRLLDHGVDTVRDLLALIPGLDIVVLPESDRCCGAAGLHFLEQPAHAAALREWVLDDIDAAAPDLVVSTNIGCRLFLAGTGSANRRTIPILHPVELLARQLPP